MPYSIQITSAAEKDLADIPEQERPRIISAIQSLADNPRPAGVLKMTGFGNAYRIRVGAYRVIYGIHDKILLVVITAIGNRKEIYPLLKRRLKK